MDSVLERRHIRTLPPLILHPFADASGPSKLVESSRASLMLQGLLPAGDLTPDQIEARLLEGRYCEIRMLFYVGKDLVRWVEQCMEAMERYPDLIGKFNFQSFVTYLIMRTPPAVQAKLRKWGVADYRSIFSRAIALNAVFASIPDRRVLNDDFVRNYYRYADNMFKLLLETPSNEIDANDFDFELYASGEYSRMLERQWGGEAVE